MNASKSNKAPKEKLNLGWIDSFGKSALSKTVLSAENVKVRTRYKNDGREIFKSQLSWLATSTPIRHEKAQQKWRQ